MGIGKRFWTWLWRADERRNHIGEVLAYSYGPLGWLRAKIYRPLRRHWLAHWQLWVIVATTLAAGFIARG